MWQQQYTPVHGSLGLSALVAALLASLCLGMSPRRLLRTFGDTARQLALPAVTFAAILGLAFLMNYSGATRVRWAWLSRRREWPFRSSARSWVGWRFS